jgi:CRP-like cAMP-binding protein
MFWEKTQHSDVFKSIGTKHSFPPNSEFELGNDVAYLESGICAVATVTPEGNDRIYLYFKSGNLMGFLRHILPVENFADSHIHKVRNRVVSKTKAEIYTIKKDDFFHLLSSNPEYYKVLTLALAQNLSNVMEHSAWLACENAPVRICSMLLEFSECVGGIYLMPRCFTQAEMAHFLSLHKITVAKVLKSLREAGFIRKDGQLIRLVDREALIKIVNRELCIRY